MSFTGLSPADRKKMCDAIGISSVGELFSDIPSQLHISSVEGLPGPLSEIEIERAALVVESEIRQFRKTFLGAGAYNHYVPPVVDEISSRSEFYTSYTPYQPEVSQGTLGAIFEFQTMMSRLCGMDLTNASMYDGATSMAEAAMMAVRTNGLGKVLVSRGVHPNYRKVLDTYAWAAGFEVEQIPLIDGITDINKFRGLYGENISAVIIQNPNFFGLIEDIEPFSEITGAGSSILITVVAEAMSLGMLRGPGELGADVVCGEIQSLGNPLNFGGPYAGYISAKKEFMRRIPGRLVGQTLDSDGNRVYTLTLQTREQHIRREKATSNICTNEGLVALRTAVYLSLIGVQLKELAVLNHQTACYLHGKLKDSGIETLHDKTPFFNEFVIKPSSCENVMSEFLKHGINPGLDISKLYPEYEGCILLCATEMITKDDADEYVRIIGGCR
ncbi:MAG: aminomethyl-transferring glycine dehydrogenase [Spirochaetae bacterium HGW-Spirochaetae-5]|nr:MAG: aminomethyl-transferring glycine dehydrogenase [Spirochaetae bacterium HGW-Spirochaetae-5]